MRTLIVASIGGETSSPIGGQISSPIAGETRYTISCLDLKGATQTKSATVRIIPAFHEL
jgi:hypothetical protein